MFLAVLADTHSIATQTVLLFLLLGSGAAIVLQLVLVTGHKLRRDRRAAFEAAVRMEYTDAVLSLLADEADEPARRAFLAALPANAAAREVVAELLLTSVAKVRGTARDGVLRLLDEATFTAHYLRALGSRSARQRALAAEALGEMQAEQALPELLRALHDRSMDVRVVAARALGKLARPEAVEPLLAGFAEGRLPSGAVSSSILRMGPAAGPGVQMALADARDTVRALAAELVGLMGWVLAVDELVTLLNETYRPARLNATRSLGRLGADEGLEPLLAALGDADAEVRAAAARALGQIGVPSAARALRTAMGDAEHGVRQEAGQALLNLGTAGVVELAHALRGSDLEARRYAVEMLQRAGHAERMARQWASAPRGEWSDAVAGFLAALARAGGMATIEEAGIQLDAKGWPVRAGTVSNVRHPERRTRRRRRKEAPQLVLAGHRSAESLPVNAGPAVAPVTGSLSPLLHAFAAQTR